MKESRPPADAPMPTIGNPAGRDFLAGTPEATGHRGGFSFISHHAAIPAHTQTVALTGSVSICPNPGKTHARREGDPRKAWAGFAASRETKPLLADVCGQADLHHPCFTRNPRPPAPRTRGSEIHACPTLRQLLACACLDECAHQRSYFCPVFGAAGCCYDRLGLGNDTAPRVQPAAFSGA